MSTVFPYGPEMGIFWELRFARWLGLFMALQPPILWLQIFEHAVALRLFLVNLLFCSKTSEVASNQGEQPLGSHKVGLVLAVHPRLQQCLLCLCCSGSEAILFQDHFEVPRKALDNRLIADCTTIWEIVAEIASDTFWLHKWFLMQSASG